MKTLRYTLISCLLALSATINAMGSKPDPIKAASDGLAGFVATGEVPGLAAALITPSGVTYVHYGVTAGATPFTPDEHTVFHVASISKLFTSVSLAFLVNEGKVALDDTLESRLTDGGKAPSLNGKEILVWHLASHISGLPENNIGKSSRQEMAHADWKLVYDRLGSHKLEREPGKKYGYSNIGMTLLGHLEELAYGKPYEQMVIDLILDPLGMGETRVTLDPKQPKPIFTSDFGIFAPAGGFHSCVTDLVKFARAAIGGAPEPLARALALTYERRGTDEGGRQLHLGWNEEGSADRLSHTGFQHAYLGIDRVNKVGAVILCTGQTLHIGALGNAVVTALAGGKASFPVPRKVAKVSASRLGVISGTYSMRGGDSPVTVKPDLERGILLLSFNEQEWFDMIPESDSVYFCRLWSCDLIAPAGKPASIKLKMSGWTGDYDRK